MALLLLVQVQAAPTPAPLAYNPRAGELFEREPLLKAWALRFHDRNGDGWLTGGEAAEAAEDFRSFADRDGDGRVTIAEYRAAVASLAARR